MRTMFRVLLENLLWLNSTWALALAMSGDNMKVNKNNGIN